jgi:hypothetical protein
MKDKEKIIKALDIVAVDRSQANYFFQRLSRLDLYYALKERGFFLPEKIEYDSTNNALFWPVLDYLEKVSAQVICHPEYGKELIDIIRNVVNYSRNQKKINNYYIWWYCVKIIINLPNSNIKADLPVEEFKLWLYEWTEQDSVQHQTIDDISEKLLPKFLADDATIPYAEAIINVITGIRTSNQTKTTIGRKDADLVWDSYWLQEAFKNNLALIAQKCSDQVIYGIADKLKLTLEYHQDSSWAEYEIGPNLYKIKVARIPDSTAGADEIKYKENSYECVVGQYSADQVGQIDPNKDIWKINNTEPAIELKRFSFEAQNKNEFVMKIEKGLPTDVEFAKAKDYHRKPANIFDELYSDYSYIWFKSLTVDDPVSLHDARGVLTSILRNLLLARCEVKREEAQSIVEAFFSDRYPFPVFKRVALLAVNKHWQEYYPLMKMFVELKPNVLAYPDWEIELYDLFSKHGNELNQEIKNKITQLINDVPDYYIKEGPKHVAYWKYKWFSPLKDIEGYKTAYNEAKQQAEIKEDKMYEPDRSTMEAKSIGNISPVPLEELIKMPTIELIRYLLDFKGADLWGRMEGKPDKRGLANVLQAAVKEKPERYLNDLAMFNQQGLYLYVNTIFKGFTEALKAAKILPWAAVLSFAREYINQTWFIDEAFSTQGEDKRCAKRERIWVVEAIADLIKEGSRDDERSIGPDDFGMVENIYGDIARIIIGDNELKYDRSAWSHALNTTLGHVAESYIVFSLRVARIMKKKDEKWKHEKWGENKYERFLDKGIEAYAWLGRYLPNIEYLDKDYTEQKIEALSQLNAADKNWLSFVDGYLSGAYFYDDIYKLMRVHYIKALEACPFEKEGESRLAQHVTLGYLRGMESLEKKNNDGQDSLFYKMLFEADTEDKKGRWLNVVNFFWSISGRSSRKDAQDNREKISDDYKDKILLFWGWAYINQGIIEKLLGSEYTAFLGALTKLTILLDKIDENNEKWLLLSAPYIDKQHLATFFIEYLTRYEDEESLKKIGKIYLKILEGATPTFRQEDIRLIVERLYGLKNKYPEMKNDADDICNTYGRRGIHILKDLYEKNQ